MKKLCPLFFILLILLSSCRQEELISVPIFISRFNKVSEYNIDKNDVCAVEDGDILVYNFLLENGYLVTLRSEKEKGRIKQCTVTSKADESLKENDFFDVCKNVLRSYAKLDKKSADDMLCDFNFRKNEKSEKNGFLRFDFTKNEIAIFLSIENSRLNNERVTDKKLSE